MKNIKLIVLMVAFGLLIQAQTSFAQTVDERLKRAAAAIDKKDLDGAMTDLNEVFKVDSNNARAYDLRGLVYYGKNNYELAIADYTKAINLAPNAPFYYSNRGLAYHYNPNHDYKSAFYDFTSAIKIDPNNKDFYYYRGKTSYMWELTDFGVRDFTQAIKLGMNTSDIYRWRAVAYFNQGRYAQCIADARKTLELDPNDDAAKKNLAKAIALQKQSPAQIQIDKLIVGELPKSLLASESPQIAESFSRVVKLLNANDLDAAIKILNEVAKTNPNSVVGFYLAGIIFYKQGNCDQAYANQTKAIELNPNIAEFYYIRGLSVRYDPNTWNIDDLRGTLKDFSKAIELNPKYSDAFLERSIIIYYLYQKLNVSSELNYMTELSNSLYSNPQNGEALYFEAITYIWYDDWKKITSNLTQAISLGTNSSEIYILRGVANYKLNNRAQALVDFQKALELNPNNTVASENIQLINSNAKNVGLHYLSPWFNPVNDKPWAVKMRELYKEYVGSRAIAKNWLDEKPTTQNELCKVLQISTKSIRSAIDAATQLWYFSRREQEKKIFLQASKDAEETEKIGNERIRTERCN